MILLLLFCSLLILNGVFGADEVKVSVMEGDSVTLHTDPDEIKRDSNLKWMFKSTIIANFDFELKKSNVHDNENKIFRDRLKMNDQTGDLNITNITSQHTGEYKLQISDSRGIKHKTFRVSVSEPEPLSGMVGHYVVLHTRTEKQTDDVIEWTFERTVIAQFNRTSNDVSYKDPNGRFKDRLMLDQSGSLTITNIRSEDSGLYDVNINSSQHIIHKRFSVTVTAIPEPTYTYWDKIGPGLLIGVIVLGIGLVSVIIYYRKRLSKNEKNETSEHLNQQSSNTNDT